MSFDEYCENLTRALMAFQYLELGLKFYIRDCEKIIQKAVKDSFCYSVCEEKIEKMPLGCLIEEFSKRSNRKDIISILKKLNKHRNYIAHASYILTIEEQKDTQKLRELSNKIAKINKVVNKCMAELAREHSKVTKEPISEEILKEYESV